MKSSVHPQHVALSIAELQQRIGRIYDHLYANASVRTPAGIAAEVGKILHTGMYAETTQLLGFMGSDSVTPPAFNFDRRVFNQLLRCHVDTCKQVASQVHYQFEKMNQDWQLYEPGSKITISDIDIGYTCGQLNGIVISSKERDVFGDALEIFRSQWSKRSGGQFFTDQLVTSLAMTLLDFNPLAGDDLVDLCAGTGGFLLAGLNHLRAILGKEETNVSELALVELASKSLKGQEVDQEVCDIANATLAARLSNSTRPFVFVADSLDPTAFSAGGRAGIKYDAHLCAATNPPFGTKITVKDERILRFYDLAKSAKRLSNRAPDILFLEQNLRILKPGEGRLAIVVPYQILSGPQTFYIREWLLKQAELIAVIDLPADTFQPHTGTKGILLVLKRRKEPLADIREIGSKAIFMSTPRWIGHDRRGSPIYKQTADGAATNELLTDFAEVEAAFQAFQQGFDPAAEHSSSFTLNILDIVKDKELHMNASYYKPSMSSTKPNKGENQKNEWTYVKLQDLVCRIFYPSRFKRNYVDFYPAAVPFLGGANISQLVVNTDKWLRHDDPKLDELKVQSGWILVTRSGTTGIVSTVPEAWEGFALSEHVIRIIPDPVKLDPAYLYTFLRSKYAQDLLRRGIFGSVIDEITPEFIGEMEVPLPASNDLFNKIVEKTKKAQSARNEAINTLVESVNEMDSYLS